MKEEAIGAPPWRSRARRALRQIGPVRLLVTLAFVLLGLLFARYGWQVPLARDAERALYDTRVILTAPQADQDERIALVVYTDDTLRRVEKRSPLDRRTLAQALAAIDAMNPKAIGVDILIDQPQQEDPLLIETLQRMRTPVYFAYATNASNPEQMQVWQEEYLRGFLAQAAPGPVGPTSIRIRPDQDNVMRRWPDQPRSLPPLMPNSLTGAHTAFRLIRGSRV